MLHAVVMIVLMMIVVVIVVVVIVVALVMAVVVLIVVAVTVAAWNYHNDDGVTRRQQRRGIAQTEPRVVVAIVWPAGRQTPLHLPAVGTRVHTSAITWHAQKRRFHVCEQQ
jgi:hypothetical protein